MYDLIVIGGGPAGLTATMYALRKHLKVLMITKDLGGKTNYHLELPWVENYQVIRGLEVVNKFRSELEYLEFTRFYDIVISVTPLENEVGYRVTTANGTVHDARALIIATGTQQKLLGVTGEKELSMHGLSYSALSYAPLFMDRTAAVVGDGDLALRSTAELAIIAQQVYLVMRNGEALDSELGRKLIKTPNVQILEGVQVIGVECEPEVTGVQAGGNGHAETTGTHYARCLALKDPEGGVTHLAVDGIFVEMGLLGNTQMLYDLVVMDADGRIRVDNANRTSRPGIFAAGDVTTVYAEQVLVAVGEGAKAALSAYDYLLPKL